MSIDAKRRYAAAGFVLLLVLSVLWPSPVVSTNRLWLHNDLAVDELSFLGREALPWDVVFWCIAGLFTIAILHGAEAYDFAIVPRQLKAFRVRRPRRLWLALAITIAAVALTWLFLDAPITAWAELIQSDATEDAARLLNRLGGGMNPALLIGFFVIAGVAYRSERWVGYGVAMAIAGLSAGLAAQIVKLIVGRSRPELWLGPFHYARGSANSFPSGHTVGAFALAGVLVFASRNVPLRVIAFLLAAAIGFSRILAFRHWTSDVVASAAVGLLVSWVVTAGVTAVTRGEQARP